MATTTLALRKEVNATLKRLEKKDLGLKRLLDKAHAYAVFPAVGKAALIVGGAYGKGLVFEKGKPIGHATIGQTTIGVQVGGDTFAEVVVFDSKEPLERFKKGKLAFAANASAVLVKAGAAATADFEKGVAVFAYPQGGMLLEAAIGGQKFKFKPMDGQGGGGGQSAEGKSQSRQQAGDEQGQEDEGGGEEGEGSGEGQDDGQSRGLLGRTAGGIGNAASKVTGLVKEHPVAATLIGVGVIGALYAVRAMRSSGGASGSDDDQDSGEDDQQDQGEEEYGEEGEESDEQGDSEAQDSGEEDEGEDQSEGSDEGEDEQDPEPVRRRGRSRA